MATNNNNKNLKAYKKTNTVFWIALVPFLLLAIFSALIMFNAKNAGGYANIFGYYVIEVPNSTLFNDNLEENEQSSKQIFKVTNIDDIKAGDIIAYYSKESSNVQKGTPTDWQPLEPADVGDGTLITEQEVPDSEIKVVKLADKKRDIVNKDDLSVIDTVFAYYNEDGDLMELPGIPSQDIIGVSIQTNQTVATVLDFAKTTEGLLLFILLPCALLLIMKITSLSFYRKYRADVGASTIVFNNPTNDVSYSQAINANKVRVGAQQRSPRPTIPTRPVRKTTQQTNFAQPNFKANATIQQNQASPASSRPPVMPQRKSTQQQPQSGPPPRPTRKG